MWVMKKFSIAVSLILSHAISAPVRAENDPKRLSPSPLCEIPTGTKLVIETVETISSEKAKAGEAFSIRLARPVIINGKIIVEPGVTGVGSVIHAQPRQAFSGRAGELVLSARYLELNGTRINLGNSSIEIAGGQSRGWIFADRSVAPTLKGAAVEVPRGTFSNAETTSRCSPSGSKSVPQPIHRDDASNAHLLPLISAGLLNKPAEGMGRVVIYRVSNHVDGYGSSCKVRDQWNGKEQALPNIKGNSYLVFDARPGMHHFSVKIETTDRLTFEVGAGSTHYLKCIMAFGVMRARPDIRPSSPSEFATYPKLKPLASR
jgi:hypothetical protein